FFQLLLHAVHLFFFLIPPPPGSTLFPYTTLFRSWISSHGPKGRSRQAEAALSSRMEPLPSFSSRAARVMTSAWAKTPYSRVTVRSEEHTSELQSRFDLVCRLLLEKKKSETESEMS